MARKTFQRSLGAHLPTGTTQVVLFIPGLDRDGQAIDQARWRNSALETLGRLFRGATAFPPSEGVWRDDERAGKLLFESVVMVLSYVNPADLTGKALAELRRFLHDFGRETNQGEVGVIVGGSYYGISRYDPAQRIGR
ncbi:MAG: hypothetical protein HYT87_19690 [Nitrospirae bacterium]|nr:hypothetical protein [Nitrospirota bacterium]